MLQLKDIKKDYVVAGGTVSALKGISLNFRKNEFVSILGASGCGKTTLLNIIGGLDKYTSGDLIINGVSTKEYGDRDWDTYRNHSIGFIFQSYHLIPHQTILQNVELALMISGISKEERRQRAIEALDKVGLKDKINNRPNQLSGGQAQRVAIARALINDPEIVLADEPTGALDSKTSVQIMDLLKEISKDRLVIMVTHNPELAEQYSTRIIRLMDGLITDDSMPYGGEDTDGGDAVLEESANETLKTNKGKKKRSSMSFGMAFMLSLKNLLSKIKRTSMVAIAGSIGIIGVSMVLAISAGVQSYIVSMEDDMLSGYPLAVTETAVDVTALMESMNGSGKKIDLHRLDDKVYVDSVLDDLMKFNGATITNIITPEYKDFVDSMPSEYYNALQFGYNFDMSNYIYTEFAVGGNSDKVYNSSITGIRSMYTSVLGKQDKYSKYAPMISTVSSFMEMPDYKYILKQYEILATDKGKTENLSGEELEEIFNSEDGLILVVNDNAFADLNFGQFGYMTEEEFLNFAYKAAGDAYDENIIWKYNGKWLENENKYDEEYKGLDYSFFIGEDAHSFTWYPNDAVYSYVNLTNPQTGKAVPYMYNPYSDNFDTEKGMKLKVKAIIQKKDDVTYGSLSSGLYYTEKLTRKTIASAKDSEIVKFIDGLPEKRLENLPYNYEFSYPAEGGYATGTASSIIMSQTDMMSIIMSGGANRDLSVGVDIVAGTDLPNAFYIYPLDFESKDLVTDYLDLWNTACGSSDGILEYTNKDGTVVRVTGLTENDKIKYTDTVGLMITMINTMIQMITIALIAFTALSLVVSTVMVGIITYVSVVERIKEIGILRSVGARKKDIKRLFIAETFIIGLAAGLVGVIITYILSLVINLIVGSIAGIFTIASLPVWQALIMVLISVILTLISGLIPASAAAKKDPVVALRTE